MKPELHYDAVVIGTGVAGLTAAVRLAEAGARVCVLAKGVGSTHLAAGTVDVLGYDGERVELPLEALPDFIARRPDHPYALLGPRLDRTGARLVRRVGRGRARSRATAIAARSKKTRSFPLLSARPGPRRCSPRRWRPATCR